MKERLLEILVKFATENNKQIISEGVETVEVAKYVKDQNVFLEQGYLFSKPMSDEAFNEYLERHQYRVILEDISNIEDTERIMQRVGGDQEQGQSDEDVEYISPEEYLRRTVEGNQAEGEVVYEEVPAEEEEQNIEDLFDDLN